MHDVTQRTGTLPVHRRSDRMDLGSSKAGSLPPSGLVASATSPTQVALIWQDTSAVEDGFQIERRGGTSAEFSQIGIVSANSIAYADGSVLPNTAYAYRVRAFNGTGVSSFTNEASVITPSTPSVLAIGTTDLPDATVGVAYSRTLTAVGGRPDFAWLIDSGTLPRVFRWRRSGSLARALPQQPEPSTSSSR